MEILYFILAYVVTVLLSRWLNLFATKKLNVTSDVWYIGWLVPVWNCVIIVLYGLAIFGYYLGRWDWWKGE